MQWTFYHIPLVLGVVLSFVLGAFVFRYRKSRGGRPLLGFLLFGGFYCLVYAVQLTHTSLSESLFWSRLTFPAFGFAALFFLLFAVEYTNKEGLLTGDRVLLLAIPPVFVSVAPWLWSDRVYRNPQMGEQLSVTLLRFEFGDVYLLVLGIVFAYIFSALALAVVQFVRSGRAGIFQRQTLGVVGLSIPALAGLLQAFLPIQMALAPVSFVLAGLVLTLAILRYELFEIMPIARQRVFQHVDAGVLVVGPNGRILDANPQAERLFANTDLVNSDFNRLNVSINTTDLQESDGQDLYEQSDSHGERRIYQIDHAQISDGYNQFNGWVVLFNDVTDREQRKQELERQRDELEETSERLERKNERLDKFASLVSHDLRNPLSVAEARLELASDECDSEHLDAVGDAHDRMLVLIEDLLTLAREGKAVTDVEPVGLRGLLEGCWQNVDTREATLRIETDLTVEADQSRLQQLLENLLRNAIDHGGEDVTITVGDVSDADGFYVEDDGPGIPAEKREQVFEAGYSTAHRGTGFGLNIVKEIVDAHDWTVQLTDGADGGARFEITGIET